ncbi:MAG: FecR domain-containing protein [Alcanivoracaceae bacterium]|nr:FecR domain-containing protein [Alcanivoracaceae bacterium]
MRRIWLALWCCIMAGQLLAEDVQYTFRPGDSLWRVCENFARDPNFCWRELANHNGISSPRAIPPGAVLNIPADWLKQQPAPAKLMSLSGDVTLYRKSGETETDLSVGSVIDTGDALETGSVSSARVIFADQSELLIKPQSLVIFDRYSRFEDTGMVDTSLRLERGELRTYVRPRGTGNSRFIIVTPSAAAAVRGTRFDVEVDQEEVTHNIVHEGTVALSAQGKEQLVDAGFASSAAPGEAPTAPTKVLPPVSLASHVDDHTVDISWSALPDAKRYWLELFSSPDKRLLRSESIEGDQWQAQLSEGEYQVIVRAIDAGGIRGGEAIATVAIAEPVQPDTSPEALQEDQQKFWPSFGVFLLGAAIILSL